MKKRYFCMVIAFVFIFSCFVYTVDADDILQITPKDSGIIIQGKGSPKTVVTLIGLNGVSLEEFLQKKNRLTSYDDGLLFADNTATDAQGNFTFELKYDKTTTFAKIYVGNAAWTEYQMYAITPGYITDESKMQDDLESITIAYDGIASTFPIVNTGVEYGSHITYSVPEAYNNVVAFDVYSKTANLNRNLLSEDTSIPVKITASINSKTVSKTISILVKGTGNYTSHGSGSSNSSSKGSSTPKYGGGEISISGGMVPVVLPNVNIGSETNGFNDLDSVPWAIEAINNLHKYKVIDGVSGTEFAPNDPVTREQLVKMIVTALKLDESADVSFNDVRTDEWYYTYLRKAYQAKLIKGKDNGAFGIGENITRQDMAVIIGNVIDTYNIATPFADLSYSDNNKISDYAKVAVKAVTSLSIMKGNSEGCFDPLLPASRAEAAVVINNLLKEIVDKYQKK